MDKYNYSLIEKIFMFIFSSLSNFSTIFTLVLIFRRKLSYPFFTGSFTLLTSFMYHTLDSFQIPSFFLNELQWHKLDNIGAIISIISLNVYLMDNRSRDLDNFLNYTGFFITLILQSRDPWDLTNTFIPILIFLLLFIWARNFRRIEARSNKRMIRLGIFIMFLGFCSFCKGLDEFKDYLRFYHGLWHFFVGISTFYLWQSNIPPGLEYEIFEIFNFKKPMNYIEEIQKFN